MSLDITCATGAWNTVEELVLRLVDIDKSLLLQEMFGVCLDLELNRVLLINSPFWDEVLRVIPTVLTPKNQLAHLCEKTHSSNSW